MLVSEFTGRKVVSVATADTVGKVDHVVIDPRTRSVMALELKKTDSGHVLRWADVTALGTDAITVADAALIGEPDEAVAALADKHLRPLGKRVLSSGGDELGEVEDIDVDPATGAVKAFVVAGQTGTEQVAGQRLIGIGSYAVVVAV